MKMSPHGVSLLLCIVDSSATRLKLSLIESCWQQGRIPMHMLQKKSAWIELHDLYDHSVVQQRHSDDKHYTNHCHDVAASL